ncbi:MAG: hypothetical protein KAJ40_04270 [Alphaproteobacteria bacterium]|nr:hypothetical protein [Alphaproteobacteria bacterium]
MQPPYSRLRQPVSHQNNQKGNALWFVLLAVMLFGALAAALSRNTGIVNQTGNIEQFRVKAASLLRYSTSIETSVQRLLLEGLSENNLDFEAIGSDYENTNCADEKCEVFSTAGGGILYRNLSSVINEDTNENWIISAQNRIYLAGCDDASSSCSELLLIAPDISRTLCLQINAMQNITNTGGNPPEMGSFLIDEKFDGSFTDVINSDSLGGTNASNEATEVQGRSTACIMSSDIYYFYQLLVTR